LHEDPCRFVCGRVLIEIKSSRAHTTAQRAIHPQTTSCAAGWRAATLGFVGESCGVVAAPRLAPLLVSSRVDSQPAYRKTKHGGVFGVRSLSRAAHYIWGPRPHQGTSRSVLVPLDVWRCATAPHRMRELSRTARRDAQRRCARCPTTGACSLASRPVCLCSTRRC
jgi:hypothetical protein